MRVLFITNYFPPDDVGGAEIAAYNTCYGLRQQEVDASVLAINARLPIAEDRHYDIWGVPVHKISRQRYRFYNALAQVFDFRVYQDVLAELRRIRPDVVHVHNVSGATLAPFVACKRLGVPVVLTLHDHWLLCPNNMLYRRDGTLCDPAAHSGACGRCFRRYDYWAGLPGRRRLFARLVDSVRLFISPSQKLVDLHVAAGYDRSRFRVVRYGIGHSLVQEPSNPLLRETVRQHGLYHTLLFAGAVVETKGIQTIIDALPSLLRYVDRCRLVVAGSGDERFLAALKRFDPTQVRLLGRMPFREMRALYATADLTLAPSVWYDNSPMVILESLLVGTPVLGSAIGGIPELIQEGQTGYVIAPGDAPALIESVVRHFGLSAPERRAMRRRCACYVQDQATLEQHTAQTRQLYGEALRL
jgi:glycosyltransferase involved in cell wall biosynthesis